MINENKTKAKNNSKEMIKNFKFQTKSWKKELGLERSKKIKADKKIDILGNHLKKLESISKESIACQTNHTIDVPYSVSEPDLSNLSWVKVTEEEIIADKAKQALNEQHDGDIDDMIERLESQQSIFVNFLQKIV